MHLLRLVVTLAHACDDWTVDWTKLRSWMPLSLGVFSGTILMMSRDVSATSCGYGSGESSLLEWKDAVPDEEAYTWVGRVWLESAPGYSSPILRLSSEDGASNEVDLFFRLQEDT